MAGTVVNDYAIGDVNFNSMMETLDKQRRGYSALTLTNFDNTSAPAIAAGSLIEVDGSLVHFASEEAITGSPSDGTVYIKIIVADGEATAEYTNTAPVWSDSKQGWYGEDASASHRYIARMVLISTEYSFKILIFTYRQNFDMFWEYIATEQSTGSTSIVDVPSSFSGSLEVNPGDIVLVWYSAMAKEATADGFLYTALGASNTATVYTDYAVPYGISAENGHFITMSMTTDYVRTYACDTVKILTAGVFQLKERFKATTGGTTYVKERYIMMQRILVQNITNLI